jgi:hypothetical protein
MKDDLSLCRTKWERRIFAPTQSKNTLVIRVNVDLSGFRVEKFPTFHAVYSRKY